MNIEGVRQLPSIEAESPQRHAAQAVRTSSSASINVAKIAGATKSAVASSSGGAAKISKPGEILNRLQALAVQNPERFQKLMSEASTQLRDAANASGDSSVNRLADDFANAADTGSVESLDPTSLGADASSSSSGASAVARRQRASMVPQNAVDSSTQDALSKALSARVDAALGLCPPPFGPWFPR